MLYYELIIHCTVWFWSLSTHSHYDKIQFCFFHLFTLNFWSKVILYSFFSFSITISNTHTKTFNIRTHVCMYGQMSSVSVERDVHRRASSRQNTHTAKAGLQLDIERLFARQIKYVLEYALAWIPHPSQMPNIVNCNNLNWIIDWRVAWLFVLHY